jgi:hypothetical protein
VPSLRDLGLFSSPTPDLPFGFAQGRLGLMNGVASRLELGAGSAVPTGRRFIFGAGSRR